jgi:hypothetical protein
LAVSSFGRHNSLHFSTFETHWHSDFPRFPVVLSNSRRTSLPAAIARFTSKGPIERYRSDQMQRTSTSNSSASHPICTGVSQSNSLAPSTVDLNMWQFLPITTIMVGGRCLCQDSLSAWSGPDQR